MPRVSLVESVDPAEHWAAGGLVASDKSSIGMATALQPVTLKRGDEQLLKFRAGTKVDIIVHGLATVCPEYTVIDPTPAGTGPASPPIDSSSTTAEQLFAPFSEDLFSAELDIHALQKMLTQPLTTQGFGTPWVSSSLSLLSSILIVASLVAEALRMKVSLRQRASEITSVTSQINRQKALLMFINLVRWVRTVHDQHVLPMHKHQLFRNMPRPSPYPDLIGHHLANQVTLKLNHVKKSRQAGG
ncbi:hypothetical protein WJX82_009636 [Trebouxia sp. C0006]